LTKYLVDFLGSYIFISVAIGRFLHDSNRGISQPYLDDARREVSMRRGAPALPAARHGVV
jgi:hypothetical protein